MKTMKKSNVVKIETLAQDFLQYRYKIWLLDGKRAADWTYYQGACDMITAFGGSWRRNYHGNDTDESSENISNYSHTVWFPKDEYCTRLNENAWKE